MAAHNRGIIPAELACKISPDITNLGEGVGRVGKTTLTVATILLLFGWAGAGRSDYNGVVYLLGPWISPAIIAGLYSAVLATCGWKAYRGRAFLGRPTYVVDDPAVARLNAIFNSGEARRHLWRESFRLSCVMFVVVWTAALLLRPHLNWTWPSARNDFLLNKQIGEPGSWFWVSMFGPLVLMFVVLFNDYHRWCLKMWVKREVAARE